MFFLNLRRPQDIWHATIPAHMGSVEIAANTATVPPVQFQAAVAQRDRVDAWTKKQPPLVCSMLLVKKVKLAAHIVHYYTGNRQPLTKENMEYVFLKDYNDYLKLVNALKKDQDINLMKCQKDTVTLCWVEAALTFMNVYIGTWNSPLLYIVRDEAHPDPQRPPLLADKYYPEEHNSIKGELIAYLSHTHSLYKEDNANVFELLEESLRGSSMDPNIQPYKRRKDGGKAWVALNQQHAGVDK